MMKKLILLIALVISGTALAQVPQEAQITEAQQLNTKRVTAKVNDMKMQVEQKVVAITAGIAVSKDQKESIAELVNANLIIQNKINNDNLSENAKADKLSSAKAQFEKQMHLVLGEEKFALVKKLL